MHSAKELASTDKSASLKFRGHRGVDFLRNALICLKGNSRTLELWGEGYNWFDLKRWHDPIKRVAWEAGNPESGNRGEGFAQTFSPDDFYGWVI